jgi:aubergine-like protein
MKLYYNLTGATSSLEQVKSPNQGTFISKNVASDDNEFFLVSQQSLKGLATPSCYFIMENDLLQEGLSPNEVKEKIAVLTFKLCFLYYNTIGGIKTPAPVHYASRLADFVKDNSSEREQIQPHEHLGNIQSLFYI